MSEDELEQALDEAYGAIEVYMVELMKTQSLLIERQEKDLKRYEELEENFFSKPVDKRHEPHA